MGMLATLWIMVITRLSYAADASQNS